MNTGILATAWMCLLVGQAANNTVEYRNDRHLRIPVTIQEAHRSEIRELLLYASTDQGRSWFQATSTTPQKGEFVYHAGSDGLHWLRVAVVNQQGKQDPDDKAVMSPNAPVDQKIMIDTVQPVIRVIQAQRHGDDVYVKWDIQEDNPDSNGLELHYQAKDALPTDWTPVSLPFALKGETTFRPKTSQPITIKLTVRDLAKNQSYAQTRTDGTLTTAAFTNQGANPGTSTNQELPTLPGNPLPLPSPRPDLVKTIPPLPQQTEVTLPPHQTLSPPPTDSFQQGNAGSAVRIVPKEIAPPPKEKVIADSREPERPVPPKTGPATSPATGPSPLPMHNSQPVASSEPVKKPLPELIYVNNHKVTLEYAVNRIGPSGVGSIELWLTKDEGESWERFAFAKDVNGEETGKQKRTFDFRDKEDRPFTDGIFGLNLVVKNRAGLGREPRSGDAPEIRIEIDTQAPIAMLYQPIVDPHNKEQVLLRWSAKDKNLSATPIHLEYAAKREGPWLPIKLDLENKGRFTKDEITGDYSWKVPTDIPVQVYLRMRVRDKAGNESIAVTAEPQYVDLIEPNGALIGAQSTKQN
jgi:hypothetical protein